MDINYKLTVNNTTPFNLNTSEITDLNTVNISPSQLHVLKNCEPFNVEIIKTDFDKKKYTIKVNGNLYNVSIASPLDNLINEMGFAIGASKQINSIKAPMPGLILEMSVVVGQEVKQNDCLLILEAMKMENSFLSPRAGIIKTISVTKGEAVEKGQLLIEFE